MKKSVEEKPRQRSRWQSFKQFLGFKFVPQRYLMVVRRDGMFEGFLEPGHHWVSRWQRTTGELVSIGIRVIETGSVNCRSSDSFSFQLRAKARFMYDPRKCDNEAIVIELIERGDSAINHLMQDKVAAALRNAAGRHLSSELRSGAILDTLQRNVTNFATREVKQMGITMIGSIDVLEVIPPERIERHLEEGAGRRDFARQIEELPEDAADRIYEAETMKALGRGGGSVRMYRNQNDRGRKPVRDVKYTKRRTGNRPNSDAVYGDED
jgi:hypothetical protein